VPTIDATPVCQETAAVSGADEGLAKIVSYLTFDGHLRKNLNSFYLSSADFDTLKNFEELVVEKFRLTPHYEKGTGFGESHKCKFSNTRTGKLLFQVGVPKGDKMLCAFRVPAWIKASREYSRAYL